MAVDDVFQVGGEIGVQGGGVAQFLRVRFGQGEGFGEQAAGRRFGRAYDRHGARVPLDDHFRARADALQERGKVLGGLGIGDVNDFLERKINYTPLGKKEHDLRVSGCGPTDGPLVWLSLASHSTRTGFQFPGTLSRLIAPSSAGASS